MFTVKHIHPSSGDETLREGDYVYFELEAQRLVLCSPGSSVETHFNNGDIFVMNKDGQTVAIYRLGMGIGRADESQPRLGEGLNEFTTTPARPEMKR